MQFEEFMEIANEDGFYDTMSKNDAHRLFDQISLFGLQNIASEVERIFGSNDIDLWCEVAEQMNSDYNDLLVD